MRSRPSGCSRRRSSARTASSGPVSGWPRESGSSLTRTGHILPHERTFPGPKEARLRLLRATRTKLSPILLLHEGKSPIVPARPPDLEAVFGGARSRLWRVDDQGPLDAVGGHIVIADGHHRYETALRFHEEDGSEETSHVLAVLVARTTQASSSSRPIAWSAVRFPS